MYANIVKHQNSSEMKQTKTAKELRELDRRLTELVETKGCTDGMNLKCPMTNPQNRNTGNTARFQIGDRARNPKRPTLESLKVTLEEIAEATNHKVEFTKILDATEARFTHNQLNTENGFTPVEITQTVDEEVNWECNHNYYR